MGKALDAYRRYRDLVARNQFDRLTEVLDENWVENCLGLTGWTLGLDVALANLQAGFGQAFSDLASTEHELVEDGDTLVIRAENTGVHTGRFLDVEPTGKRVSWEFLDMYKVGPDGRARAGETGIRTAVPGGSMVRMGSPVRFRRGAPHSR